MNIINNNYYGTSQAFKAKPKLTQEHSRLAYEKISKWYNDIGPNSRLGKPVSISVGDKKYALTINKFSPNNIVMEIKNKLASDSSKEISDFAMACYFDAKGAMKEGNYIKKINDNFSKCVHFESKGDRIRRIKMEGMWFCPKRSSANKDVWHRMENLSSKS